MIPDYIKTYNVDCMEFMASVPDKHYDLAIVDPPYGIGMCGGNVGYKGFNNLARKDWDKNTPNDQYFKELFRVSKNQIIWGGNYFKLNPTRGFIIWDKGEGFKNRSYAECELAWTSFDRNAKIYKRDPLAKGDYHGKIHPTQKPVALYKWLLKNYAKEGDKILDTHGGSMSIAIAIHDLYTDLGCSLDICELDKDYYTAGLQRIETHCKQLKLF